MGTGKGRRREDNNKGIRKREQSVPEFKFDVKIKLPCLGDFCPRS